ncbi:hypothetical protein J2Z32_003645 [Paenibacillus turicensis]|uniref:SLH domain-containing protein n=1 Tax=Paenibacillus turicensis TaxID=160487 RepID=A0ABS4FWN0_9BACL|nr:S-layer homology domain-containing protein [Paenibacillus turicensis]MBP1906980.1 hypothetical protein [Paenibacillus turicensis]
MSNKSFSIKENPYMKDIQGGEKKVMKKILSVALSTAMAFSMFASVAFGADAEKLTPEQQFNVLKEAGIVDGFPDGLAHLDQTVTRAQLAKIIVKSLALEEVTGVATYKDKNYTAKHWAAPFIEAATKAGILEGQSTNPANPIFNPTGNVTVQELAKVLVVANKLEVPTEANNTASEWAKGYVAAAIKAGYIAEGINYQANATRAQTVVAAHAIYEFNNFKVTKAEAIDANNVKLTLSTGEVVEVKLEKALEANKATELTYKAKDGRELKYTVTYVVTAATKIESVTATNLKELTVKFDGDVDAKTAETKGNYKVDGVSNVKFESATLSADKKEVKLLLTADESSKLPAQKELTLEVKNVKNANGSKTFDEKVKFTAVDTQLPTVTEVKALGTKAIKVVFSEPVRSVTANNLSNYKIDGKSINASTKFSYPNVLIISADVSVGEHKLSVQGIEDFNSFKVSPVEIDFTVVEDTTAPEVVSTKVTDLQKVEVVFNEPVKSVKKAYHSTSSKTPESIDINDNKVTLNFKYEDRLGLGDTTVYLEGVTDYSNNAADRNTVVKPELDTSRPTLNSVTAENKTNSTEITIDFSKKVDSKDIENAVNYVLRNDKGEIVATKGFNSKGNPVKTPYYGTKDSKQAQDRVIIESIGKLDAGKYTIEVAGIRDQASVANTMEPAKYDFNVTDNSALSLSAAWYKTDYDNVRFYLQFNRNLQSSGNGRADDINKYSYTVAGVNYPFPTKSATANLYSSDTVEIVVPAKDLQSGWASATTTIRAVNVADVNDNFINSAATPTPLKDQNSTAVEADSVKATDRKTIVINTKTPVSSVDASKIKVGGLSFNATVNNSNNKQVVLTFATDAIPYKADTLSVVVESGAIQDSYGRFLEAKTYPVKDEVAPVVSTGHSALGNTVNVKFSEAISVVYNPAVIKVYVDGTEVKTATATASTDTLVITLDAAVPSVNGKNVNVVINNNDTAKVVTDIAGNPVANVNVNVTGTPTTDEQTAIDTAAVAAAKTSLVASQLTVTGASTATATIALPATTTNGVAVTWAVPVNTVLTQATAGAVSGTLTTVDRADASFVAGTTTVTATFTKGSITDTKEFTITVPVNGTAVTVSE